MGWLTEMVIKGGGEGVGEEVGKKKRGEREGKES